MDYLQSCCKERTFPVDIAFTDGEYFCRKCGTYLGRSFQLDYRDIGNSIVKKYKGYNPRNHASHVLNRLECIEKNKPSEEVILQIKNKIDQESGQYTKAQINSVIKTPSLRKHIVYIWCNLNDVPFLQIMPKDRHIIITRIEENSHAGRKIRKNYHKLIEEIIREISELEYLSPYLNI